MGETKYDFFKLKLSIPLDILLAYIMCYCWMYDGSKEKKGLQQLMNVNRG